MESKRPSFGELDLGWDEVSETATPVSGVRQARIIPGMAARDSSRPEAGADRTRIGDSPLEAGMLEADPRSAGTMDDPRLDQVRALYARGDTAAALAFAERMSSRDPEPYADIQDEGTPLEDAHASDHEHGTAIFASGAGEALMQVAALTGTPYVAMGLQEIQRLPLDPRAGFLMSMIDGASTIADLCDLAGMPEDDVVNVLTELARHKVIAFK